jgi:hypothetical protein
MVMAQIFHVISDKFKALSKKEINTTTTTTTNNNNNLSQI